MEYTFKITISACAHHTWQGVLQTETGSHPFMNELELLDAISNQMYLEDMEVFPGKASLGGEGKGITGSLKAGIMFFRNLKIEMVQAFREYGKASVFVNFYFVIDLFTDYAYTVNGRYSHTSQRCVSGSVFYMGRKHK